MKEAEQLLEKYRVGNCTPEEISLLRKWFHHLGEQESTELQPADLISARADFEKNWRKVNRQPKKVALWIRLTAAASIIVALSVGLYFIMDNNRKHGHAATNLALQHIKAGRNAATLILANGKKIFLSDVKSGQLAREAGVKITKTASGQIVYEVSPDAAQPNDDTHSSLQGGKTKLSLNTLSTARGETFMLILPDKSKVWLNAASSLTYPVSFASLKERIIKLNGEAYFEVAKDKKHPFVVTSASQQVEVLGTHFNIMAYADEKIIRTTLLEGSVKVSQNSKTCFIKPGAQAQVTPSGMQVIAAVDLEDVIAWKNGYFKFHENLEDIMSKVARWYNVEVVYGFKPDPDYTFEGEISRSRNLGELLKIIEYTGKVHFKIEGRRIMVEQ